MDVGVQLKSFFFSVHLEILANHKHRPTQSAIHKPLLQLPSATVKFRMHHSEHFKKLSTMLLYPWKTFRLNDIQIYNNVASMEVVKESR